MSSTVRRDRPVRTVVTLGLAAAAASLAITASASAASLTASVSPSKVTVGHYFTIKLTGAGVPDDAERAIAFSQPNTPACQSTPQLEGTRYRYRLSTVVSDTPFAVTKTLKASASNLGKRRVCGYLYSTDAGVTLLRATTTYKIQLPLCHRGQRRGCRRH
jgi:hypothetical protein